MKVVALRQQRLLLDTLQARDLIRVLLLGLDSDSLHVNIAEVFGLVEILVERVRGVDGVKLLRGVLALAEG